MFLGLVGQLSELPARPPTLPGHTESSAEDAKHRWGEHSWGQLVVCRRSCKAQDRV